MTALYNKKNKSDLIDELQNESFERTTISFYKYVELNIIGDLLMIKRVLTSL